MNKLVETLEFYADPDNWTSTEKHMPSCMAFDKGMRAREVLAEHRAEPSSDVVAVYIKKLECFYNFPSHPNCCPDDRSGDSKAPEEYRQGWIDCYWAIYHRFGAIAAMQGEG